MERRKPWKEKRVGKCRKMDEVSVPEAEIEWGAKAETVLSDFNKEYASAIQKAEGANQQDVAKEVFLSKGPKFIEDANVIIDNYKKQCPDAFNEHVMQLEQSKDIIERQMQFFSNPAAASQPALN